VKKRLLALAIALTLSSCDSSSTSAVATTADTKVSATFMVGSDLHYFSPSLLTSTASADYHAYLAGDRKMIAESPALLHSFLDSARKVRPSFVLLTGDLTKDGEEKSHQDLADSLATLKALGIKVYVLPGNHDVYNPESMSYASAGATKVANVSDARFAAIYHDFGYGEALSRDTASLSYVAEPVPGLWILAMDACRWKDNVGAASETVGGRFLPQTVAWIKARLAEAKAKGKVVVGGMHHGINEHFAGQSTNPISKDYVVAGFDSLGTAFTAAGLKVVFTGHFHANDIASRATASGSLVDIETGSLVTSPSPFRLGSIADSVLTVRSSRIREIRYDLGGQNFVDYSSNYLLTGMKAISVYTLVGMGVDSAIANMLAPTIAGSYAAHYAGDEVMPASAVQTVGLLKSQATENSLYLASSIQALYTDAAPADSAGNFPLR